jgi:hypothetical protein
MAKLTKAQKKRLVSDIHSKVKKLYIDTGSHYDVRANSNVISAADMTAIEKLCTKWMKRIG